MRRPSMLQGVGFYRPSSISIFSSQKKVVACEIFCASNLWSLATGLMFRQLKKKQAMLFMFSRPQQGVSLHMFCVFYPIDVLFCKKSSAHDARLSFEILDIKKDFRPFTQYASSAKSCDVFIELPHKGSASLSVGEVITLH